MVSTRRRAVTGSPVTVGGLCDPRRRRVTDAGAIASIALPTSSGFRLLHRVPLVSERIGSQRLVQPHDDVVGAARSTLMIGATQGWRSA